MSSGHEVKCVMSAEINESKNIDRLCNTDFSENFTDIKPEPKSKIKIAIIDMQPIEPPVGGGRLRLFGLYHGLNKKIEAKYVGAYDWPGEKFRNQMLTPSLEEIVVPLSDAHYAAVQQLSERVGGKTVIDLTFPRFCHLSPDYISKAIEVMSDADIVVFSHPWSFPALEKYLKPTQLVVYDAQNVEGFLRAQLLNRTALVEFEILEGVVKSEYDVGQRADLIITCSHDDSELFAKIYEWSMDKICVVPNGVMVSKIMLPSIHEKLQAKQLLNLSNKKICAIFMGSYYKPNVEAANFIIDELASSLPEIDFVIAGGVAGAFQRKLPSNVIVTSAFIVESEKILWLHAADIAINPMFTGSGTNIKMFDFMAAGLPIVTTVTGARGIIKLETASILLADRQDFVSKIRYLISSETFPNLGLLNRIRVESDFAWEKITQILGNTLLGRFHRKFNIAAPKSESGFRLAFFSTIGMKCGIGEYTLRLIENLPPEVSKLIITCDSPSTILDIPIGYEVVLGWHYDNIKYTDSTIYPDLVNHLREWRANAILLQYHPGFFRTRVLLQFLRAVLKANIKIIVIIHNINRCNIDVFKTLSRQGVKFLSHSRREIAYAAGSGLNIDLIPMGIVSESNLPSKTLMGRDFKINPPVIATTGFLRRHKGVVNLIHAISLMQIAYPGTRLLIQCALYSSADSEETFLDCKNAIHEHGLDKLVDINIEFLPINVVHDNLRKADIGVLAYLASDEGGSASASTCFSAGLPVVVSDAQIFKELNDVTYQLEDTSPTSIATSLIKIFSSCSLYDQLSKKSHDYTNRVSYKNISREIIQLFQES